MTVGGYEKGTQLFWGSGWGPDTVMRTRPPSFAAVAMTSEVRPRGSSRQLRHFLAGSKALALPSL